MYRHLLFDGRLHNKDYPLKCRECILHVFSTDNRSDPMGILVELLKKIHTLCSHLVRGMQVGMGVCVYIAASSMLSTSSPMFFAIEAVGSESIGL